MTLKMCPSGLEGPKCPGEARRSSTIASERVKQLGQSRNDSRLWKCSVMKVKSDAWKNSQTLGDGEDRKCCSSRGWKVLTRPGNWTPTTKAVFSVCLPYTMLGTEDCVARSTFLTEAFPGFLALHFCLSLVPLPLSLLVNTGDTSHIPMGQHFLFLHFTPNLGAGKQTWPAACTQ